MKITVPTKEFNKKLSILTHLSSVKAAAGNPYAGTVKIEGKSGLIILSATNFADYCQVTTPGTTHEEGTVVVPFRTLNDLTQLLDGDAFTITSKEGEIKITTNKTKSSIKTLDPTNFPVAPEVTGEKVKIKAGDFSAIINSVSFAASNDNSRVELTGIKFEIKENRLTAVATDGFRISAAKTTLAENVSANILLPAGSLNQCLKAVQGSTMIELTVGIDQVKLMGLEVIYIITGISKEFVPWEKILPSNSTTKVSVVRDALFKACKLAHVISRDSNCIGRCNISQEGGFNIKAVSEETGASENTVEATVETNEAVEIAFNVSYLAEGLERACGSGQKVRMELTGPRNPAIIRPETQTNIETMYCLMPMQG